MSALSKLVRLFQKKPRPLPLPDSLRAIHKDDFPSFCWPFTVEKGALGRVGDAALFVHQGRAYALNGVATSMGYQHLGLLWRFNPLIEGARVSLTEVIALALDEAHK